jgi:hypothetical protein
MPIRIHRNPVFLLALAAVLGGCAGWPYGPAVGVALLQDGFDGENDGGPVLMYDDFAHWRVEGGTVDLVGAGSNWDFQPGNGLYVDLDGDRPDGIRFEPGVLVSRDALPLTSAVYELRFRLAGSHRGDVNTVEVRVGDVLRERITLPSDAPFQRFVLTFRVRAPQRAHVSFDNEGADGYGLLLDDVSLRRAR